MPKQNATEELLTQEEWKHQMDKANETLDSLLQTLSNQPEPEFTFRNYTISAIACSLTKPGAIINHMTLAVAIMRLQKALKENEHRTIAA